MAKVKFYRGGGASSLPSTMQDGAIFIVERGNSGLGDIYVDVSNAKRLHITPDKGFFIYNATDMSGKLSQLGEVYILLNEKDNQIGVKVGDGKAFIGDLPTYNANVISQKEKNIWNSKVDAFTDDELNSTNGDPETLVLTREFYFFNNEVKAVNESNN